MFNNISRILFSNLAFLLLIGWVSGVSAQNILETPDRALVDARKLNECKQEVANIRDLDLRCETRGLSRYYFDREGRLRKYQIDYSINDGSHEYIHLTAWYTERGDLVFLEDRNGCNCDDGEEFFYLMDGCIVDYGYYYSCECCEEYEQQAINDHRPVLGQLYVDTRDDSRQFYITTSALFNEHDSNRSPRYLFMYISDTDGYVNLRPTPGIGGTPINTLYNLQIVRVDNSPSLLSEPNWKFIDHKDKRGYIHSSRLRPLPDNIPWFYDSRDYREKHFITNINCPEVTVTINGINTKPIIKGQPVHITTEEHSIHIKDPKGREGKRLLNYRHVIDPLEYISITNDRLLFEDGRFSYFFHRNPEGKVAMSLNFHTDPLSDNPPLSAEATSVALQEFKNYVSALKHKESDALQPNNFELLDKISRLYVNGHPDVQQDYIFLLRNYPLDGAGTHAIESYFSFLWGYLNRGETLVDSIRTIQ